MSLRLGKILVIGELNADLLATGLAQPPTPGREILADDFAIVLGSASAIFACGVARLGHRVTFVSRVGDDYFGRFCCAELRRHGIGTRHVTRDPRTRTGVTMVLSTPQDRALVTHLGTIAELAAQHVPACIWRGHKHLHLTSYFLQTALRPAFPHLLAQARADGLTTSFDPNSAPDGVWPAEIWDAIAQTDVLFLNETEAAELTGTPDAYAALELLAQTARTVVIKRGAHGAIARRGDETARAPAFSVAVKDTTGAGDSFAAGFVNALMQGQTLDVCLLYGNACGALSTQAAGGTAGQPDAATLERLLAEHVHTRSQP